MAAPAFAALAGFQLVGGYFAAENIKKTAQLNNEIADMNAEFAELDAHDAELEGLSEVARYQGIVDATLGTQQAELAAADVDLNFGSAASIQTETRFLAEINKMEILNQAEQVSLGYEREARNRRIGGFLENVSAKGRAQAAKTGAITSAAATGISGYRRSIS